MTMEKVASALAFPLALLLAVGLAWLGTEHRDLRVQLRQALARDRAPQVGQWLPPHEVRSYDGTARAVLAPEGRAGKQVLYFYLPDCPYCRESEPNVSHLSAALHERPGLGEFLGISLLADRARTRTQIDGRALVMTDPRMLKVYRIAKVPTLLVVDAKGRIEFAHVGVVGKDDIVKLWTVLSPTRVGRGPSPQPRD